MDMFLPPEFYPSRIQPQEPVQRSLFLKRHWPGGVPATVRIHPDGDIFEEAMTEHFALYISILFFPTNSLRGGKEQWTAREAAGNPDEDDGEYELRQRWSLIQQWASADQNFRDVSFS